MSIKMSDPPDKVLFIYIIVCYNLNNKPLERSIMPDIIINFQSPLTLDDLIDRCDSDGLTNIDHILNFESTTQEWTVDRNCSVNDTVFFMCAVTSKDHMRRLRNTVKKCVESELLKEEYLDYANEKLALYQQYAGHIVAIGRIVEEPFMSDLSGYGNPAWKTKWYAKIGDYHLTDNAVSIDDYRGFISVSRTGSITKLSDEQSRQLLELIESKQQSTEGRIS